MSIFRVPGELGLCAYMNCICRVCVRASSYRHIVIKLLPARQKYAHACLREKTRFVCSCWSVGDAEKEKKKTKSNTAPSFCNLISPSFHKPLLGRIPSFLSPGKTKKKKKKKLLTLHNDDKRKKDKK